MILVELTDDAQAEALEAALGHETEREGLGQRFEAELAHVLARIAERPLQFPSVADTVHRALLHVFPYAVFFTLLEGRARVFAILHQHRDPHSWRGR